MKLINRKITTLLVAVACLLAATAHADDEGRNSGKKKGTIIGAILGAGVGAAVGDEEGAVAGAVLGGLAGREIGDADDDAKDYRDRNSCNPRYEDCYDRGGRRDRDDRYGRDDRRRCNPRYEDCGRRRPREFYECQYIGGRRHGEFVVVAVRSNRIVGYYGQRRRACLADADYYNRYR